MKLAMDFAVAYTTDEAKIGTALQAGRIDSGDMVLVIDSADDIFGHLVIIDKNNQEVKVSTSLRKFASKADATQWLNKTVNKPVGEIVSIRTGDAYKLNIVNATAGGGYDFNEVSGGGGGTAGVTSVNGKTGDVTITMDDIPAGTVAEIFTVTDKQALTNAINNITLIQNTMFNKNGDTMGGNIDMNGHDISNIQRIHVNGNAPLYIGSTIEPAGTQGTRITGTNAGEISFVKADTQNTLSNINVGEPTNASHAATKKYVDDSIANNSPVKSVNTKTGDVVLNATDVGALPTAGGTMTGNLILNGAPTANNGAATKKYVDDSVAAAGNVPPSTAADQGKVLTVDATGVAVWDTANSDAVLVVGFTEAGGVISADKTVAEIVAEHAKSKEVIGVLGDTVFQLIDASANHVEFTSATQTGIVSLSATTGTVFTKVENEFVTGSEPTVAEAGKVLIVNAQGKAEWTDMPDGKFMLITLDMRDTPDKTFADVSAAIDNGITTVLKRNDYYYTLSMKEADRLVYVTRYVDTFHSVEFNSNNTIVAYSREYVQVNYGISDAGKLLGVNAQGKVEAIDNPIPTILAADAGKFLVAKADGSTEWVEIPESKYMLITLTIAGGGRTIDKPYSEIRTAIDNGQLTILTCENKYYTLSEYTTDSITYTAVYQKWSYNVTIRENSVNTDFIELAGMNGWNANNQGQTLVIDGTGRLTTDNAYPVPKAVAADQNKVLTVNAAGKPEWNELDSKVKLIIVTEAGGAYVSDTTYTDIMAAINNGSSTVVKYGAYYFNLATVETTYVQYSRTDGWTMFTVSVNSTNRVTYVTYPLVKSKYTAADAGKMLGIGATGSVTLIDSPVPTVTAGDAGKVMVAKADGGTEWVTPHYVPAGGTANQVLTKVDGTDYNYEWKSVNALPTATAANEGEYLTVDANGAATWASVWDCGEIV